MSQDDPVEKVLSPEEQEKKDKEEAWAQENKYYSVYDREKIKIGYIQKCAVDENCDKHAFAKCTGEWVVPFFGVMWKGCGGRFCYNHMQVEYWPTYPSGVNKKTDEEPEERLRHCTETKCL